MSKVTGSREEKLAQLDEMMLQTIALSGSEWQSRRQLRKVLEKDLTPYHLDSLKRLEQLGFIEVRQGKHRKNGLRFEYRVVNNDKDGSGA